MPSSRPARRRVNEHRRQPALTAGQAIEQYRPHLATREEWSGVADFVRAAVRDLDPEGPHRAREWLRTVTALAVWSQREGIPLDREEIFAPDNIRRYAEIGCPELSSPSTATRRAVLRTMGRALTEDAPWPAPEPMLPQRPRHPPYSARDEHRLRSLRLPTRYQQRRLDAVLALGLGAGLWAREYLTATPSDLQTADGVTRLQVHGTRARQVVVRARDAATLLRLAAEYPRENLAGFRASEWDRSRTWNAIRAIDTPTDLRLETERLRSTWIVHHLDRGVHLTVLARHAGLKTTRAFTLLMPFLTEPPEAVTNRHLADLE